MIRNDYISYKLLFADIADLFGHLITNNSIIEIIESVQLFLVYAFPKDVLSYIKPVSRLHE